MSTRGRPQLTPRSLRERNELERELVADDRAAYSAVTLVQKELGQPRTPPPPFSPEVRIDSRHRVTASAPSRLVPDVARARSRKTAAIAKEKQMLAKLRRQQLLKENQRQFEEQRRKQSLHLKRWESEMQQTLRARKGSGRATLQASTPQHEKLSPESAKVKTIRKSTASEGAREPATASSSGGSSGSQLDDIETTLRRPLPIRTARAGFSGAAGWSCESVGWWLDAHGLSRYTRAFAAQGVDGRALLAVRSVEDARALGVDVRLHRKKLVREVVRMAENGADTPAPVTPSPRYKRAGRRWRRAGNVSRTVQRLEPHAAFAHEYASHGAPRTPSALGATPKAAAPEAVAPEAAIPEISAHMSPSGAAAASVAIPADNSESAPCVDSPEESASTPDLHSCAGTGVFDPGLGRNPDSESADDCIDAPKDGVENPNDGREASNDCRENPNDSREVRNDGREAPNDDRKALGGREGSPPSVRMSEWSINSPRSPAPVSASPRTRPSSPPLRKASSNEQQAHGRVIDHQDFRSSGVSQDSTLPPMPSDSSGCCEGGGSCVVS
jgi:hypothetical protein